MATAQTYYPDNGQVWVGKARYGKTATSRCQGMGDRKKRRPDKADLRLS